MPCPQCEVWGQIPDCCLVAKPLSGVCWSSLFKYTLNFDVLKICSCFSVVFLRILSKSFFNISIVNVFLTPHFSFCGLHISHFTTAAIAAATQGITIILCCWAKNSNNNNKWRKAASPPHTDVWITNVHLIHASLGPLDSTYQMASQSVQPFLHSSWQGVPILYFPPQNWIPCNVWFLGPTRVHDCSRQTDRHRCSVCKNRLHLHT